MCRQWLDRRFCLFLEVDPLTSAPRGDWYQIQVILGNCIQLITCVIARSNPMRLFTFLRKQLRGHCHVTMTSVNDFRVWRWHFRERNACVSVGTKTSVRNAPCIRAFIILHNDRNVWTDLNFFTGMRTEMIKNYISSCFCKMTIN